MTRKQTRQTVKEHAARIPGIVAASQARVDAKLAQVVALRLGLSDAQVRVLEHAPTGRGSMTVLVFGMPARCLDVARSLGLTARVMAFADEQCAAHARDWALAHISDDPAHADLFVAWLRSLDAAEQKEIAVVGYTRIRERFEDAHPAQFGTDAILASRRKL